MHSGYATGHFYKANKSTGLFDCLMKESSIFLDKFDIKFLNFEQDLGISGLRKSKMSFRPTILLKKYRIEPK